MNKMIALLAIPLILMGCGFDRQQPDAKDPQNRVISSSRDYGPQDIICYSGSLVTYDHKDVVIYKEIQINSTVLDVYENDTHEKVGLPISQCVWRPHKKDSM
jgi:hypothetical protein